MSLLSGIAAWTASRRTGVPSRRAVALATVVLFAGLLLLAASSTGVDVRTVKLSLREEMRPILEVKWNSYSRLAVLNYFDPSERSLFPFLAWGLSDRYKGWLPRQYLITIDGASETPMTELKEDIREHAYLAYDITALPYYLRPRPKTLIIGAGGGRDVLTALAFGSKGVTGVELNPDIVKWVRGRYAQFVGNLYDRPEVRIVVDDGRNFVRSSSETYDVLQISMIDTFAATAAGAYTLSENNLYTAEAFDEYLDRLRPDGILSINRFFLDPPQQTLRIVTLAREALARRGIEDPAAHVVAVRKGSALGANGLVMVKRIPFTSEETEQIRSLCAALSFDLIAIPGGTLENAFNTYLHERDPARFYEGYAFDVRPPTDDRPFFFNTFKMATLLSFLSLRQRIEPLRVYNYDAVFVLLVLLAIAGVCVLLLIFIPLSWGRRRSVAEPRTTRPEGREITYFVFVGLGFILVEIVLIQRFHLYLGHPIYSLSVILFTLLVSSSVGAAWSARWSGSDLTRGVVIGCGAIVTLIVLHQVCWPIFLNGTLGLPRSLRVMLASVSLAPMGIAMGIPYPVGLRMVAADRPETLPWVWAVNAAASVFGSILAFALAIAAGFRVVLLAGALCYAAALVTSVFLRAASSRNRWRGEK